VSPGGYSSPSGSSSGKKTRNRYQFASPGSIGLYRQAVPRGHPETCYFNMSCLAAMCSPLGGFWKIPRNQKTHNLKKITHPIIMLLMQL